MVMTTMINADCDWLTVMVVGFWLIACGLMVCRLFRDL